MSRHYLWAIVMLATIALSGCLVGHPASHEIFVSQSTYWVGKPIQNRRDRSGPSLGVRTLPNGHMEEEWVRGHKCRSFYEYDPKTNIIVGWRFEGSTADCISVAP
jgi:hypothetical protein